MASTIQIKRGTGSAVPSGLADGELAINLDKGQLYFGSGSTSVNSFTFKNLTAENYIVSSSVTHLTTQTLSGSTTFGDDAVDVHNRTGSFNISGALTVGKNDVGHDVIFYGATSGRQLLWDESENKLSVPALDVNGNIQGLNITATTAFVPDTQDGASLGTTSLQFSDVYLADEGKVSFGDDNDTSLTHVHNVGLLLNVDRQLQFRDSGINLKSSADGHFEINSDTILDITAPTVDINASTEVTIDTDTLTIGSANANDPLVIIKNTTNDTDGAILRFVKDKGAAGVDGDTIGLIQFVGDNDAQEQTTFGLIKTLVNDASDGAEEGVIAIQVASHDGELKDGIVVISGNVEDEVDVTLGNGAASVITIPGHIDLAGDIDVDGTLEADAITVDGVALATFIRDTVGTNMVSSNTETGITVTYDTSNDNIDFAINAAQTGITSLLATDIKIGEDDQTKIDFETADEIHFYAANVEQVYLGDNIFGPQSDSDVDLGSNTVRWKDAYIDTITTGQISVEAADQAQILISSLNSATNRDVGLNLSASSNGQQYSLALDRANDTFVIAPDTVNSAPGSAVFTLDSSGNLTISGELDAATGDFSGAVDIAGDLTLSAGGDGALTFAANSSIKIADNHATSLVIEEADTAYMTFKTTNSTELITANKGFNIAGAFQIGGTAVTSTAAELNALDGITAVVGELNALDIGSTAVGTAVASKAVILDSNKDYTGIRNLTVSGELDAATGDFSGDVDIAGTTNLDAVDIDGNVQLDGTFTVGVDDTGYDVTLFGATANRRASWDASQDHLKLYDNTKLVLGTGAAAAGFDSSLYHDGSNLYLTNTTGDIILSDTTVKITAGTAGDANLILQADTDNNDEADNPFMTFEQDGGAIRSYIGHSGADDEYPDATVFTGGLSNHLIIAHSGSDGASRGIQFGTGNNARVTINVDGEVGIGNTDPGKTLDVTGEIRASGNITANGNIIGDGATIITGIDKIAGTTDDILEITSDSDIIYKTDDDGDEAGQHIFKERTTTLLTLDETQATFTVPVNSTFSVTGDTDGTYQGDVVFFGGTTSMTTGAIYHYKSDGTWELADADDNTKSDGLLGVALGAASDANGVLLRGMVTLDHDPGAVGDPIYLTTTAGDASATAPSGNGNIVRIIGYCLHASNGQIWFNPDSTFVEVNA